MNEYPNGKYLFTFISIHQHKKPPSGSNNFEVAIKEKCIERL